MKKSKVYMADGAERLELVNRVNDFPALVKDFKSGKMSKKALLRERAGILKLNEKAISRIEKSLKIFRDGKLKFETNTAWIVEDEK